MAESLILKQVEVEKAPGFPRGGMPVVGDLQAGLNVVWGPNGAGKSTLARAMKALLWRTPGEETEAVALARVGGQDWRLERRGAALHHVRLQDNFQSDAQWGTQAEADRYWFPLQDLLDKGNQGLDFQKEILSEMQGGIDLDQACKDAGGNPQSLARQAGPYGALAKAEKAYITLRNDHARQKWIREEIAKAEASRQQALEAGQQLADNDKVRNLLKAMARLEEARSAAGRFPEGLERLSAEDPARRADLEAHQEALGVEIATLVSSLEAQKAQQVALNVSPELLAGELPKKGLQEARERLRELEPAVAQGEEALAAAQAGEKAWRDALGWLMPEPPQRPLLQGMIDQLRNLAARCEPLRCGLEAARNHLAGLGPVYASDPGDTVQTWTEFQECLKAWQRHNLQAWVPEALPRIPVRRRALALGATALLALAAATLALTLRPVFALAGLLTPVLLWILLRPERPQEDPEATRAQASAAEDRQRAQAFLETYPEFTPVPWTPPTVLDLQAKVAARIGRAESRLRRQTEQERAAADVKRAEEAYADWLGEWEDAAARLGLRPGEPALQGAPFFHFAQGLFEWVERLETLAGAQAALQEKQGKLASVRASLQERLTALGGPVEAGAGTLAARAQDLLERREAAVLLAAQIQSLETQLARKREELKKAGAELDKFWKDRGFEVPDPLGLETLAAQVEARKDALRASRSVEEECQRLRTPETLARAGTTSLEALDEADRLLREEAGKLAERNDLCISLHVKYEGLVHGDALAKAMDEELRARAALEDLQRRTTLSQVVHLLAKELKENTLLDEQPAVLRGASERLRQFTGNLYELGISADKGFFARDTVRNRIVELDELSSGTRVQVLFAVRLAFIENRERDAVRMPLFLDEVLANSDDERAHAMIRTLLEIARERQVFYFTAQTDEVSKLKGLAGPAGLREIPLHHLASQWEAQRSPLPPLELPQIVPPSPMEDYQAYGKACAVPGADPFDPIEGLHVWHLFTRSEDLHFFLCRSCSRVGQLLVSALPEAKAPRRRVEMLARAQILAQKGRGRPFHLQDLTDARLSSVNTGAEYWTGILEAAQAAHGDGFAFLEALEGVKRVGKAKAAIQDWLLENGFISEETSLSPEEILFFLFEAFGTLEAGSEDAQVIERYVRALTSSIDAQTA